MKRLIVSYFAFMYSLLAHTQTMWVQLYGLTGLWEKINKSSKKLVLKKDSTSGFILYDGSKSLDKVNFGFFLNQESAKAAIKQNKLFFNDIYIECDSLTMKDLKSNASSHFSHSSHASHYSSAK